MKKFILFICLLWSVAAMAQEPPYTPMRSNYKFRGVRIDSLFMPPAFTDTSIANAIGLNTIEGNVIRVDSIVYVRFNNRWRKQGNGAGTTIDTTSLSARIDARIKYTDSAAMLLPYLRKIDTASLSNRINQKIENIIRSSDSVYFYKNGVKTFAYKDSVGSTNGFVPYTGATQDVDLGNNGLNAKNIKITGTAGNGHIDLKHQSGDATGQANSTKLYANSSGYLKWKNDNLYYSTLAMPQTADRVYTYQNKSYTLGDSADIAARVKYTDTSAMLGVYMRKNDSATYQTKYRTDTMRTNVYNAINGKANLNPTTNYIPYNNGYSFRDSYLVNDTANSELKTVISGNSKGFNFNLNTGLYYIGDSASPTNFILNNSSNLAYINDGGNVGAVFDNLNKILSLGDYTAKTNSTYITLDDANQFIKTTNQGNEIGLKLDFANGNYLFGDEISANKASLIITGGNIYAKEANVGYTAINIEPANSYVQLGDFNNNVYGTSFTVNDASQIIKTENAGSDIGLKLDFAASDYKIGTSTANFQIINDSIKINGLTVQSNDSVINITPSGKVGFTSIAGKMNKSDSTLYQTKFRSDTMRTNIYATLNGKLNTSDSSLYQTKFRTDTMRTNFYNRLALELNISDTAAMLTNYQRNSSFPVATFGAGSGAAGDTSAFSTTALYGSFYNAGGDTIILTSYTAAVQGTSASITPTIWFNDSLNVTAGATKIVNSPSAVTSTTTGNTVTSLDNTKIPPGNFVWVSSGTVTTKPTFFTLTLIGYRKR